MVIRLRFIIHCIYIANPIRFYSFVFISFFAVAFKKNLILFDIFHAIIPFSLQVSDNRKGMKNVLNRFWRKPREESEGIAGGSTRGFGGVKYRSDKIESQILLLADTSFIVKDYETAASMYRLVRDDYKSDKVAQL